MSSSGGNPFGHNPGESPEEAERRRLAEEEARRRAERAGDTVDAASEVSNSGGGDGGCGCFGNKGGGGGGSRSGGGGGRGGDSGGSGGGGDGCGCDPCLISLFSMRLVWIAVTSLVSVRSGRVRTAVERYRAEVSPTRAPCCNFTPSCSTYAVKALDRHPVHRAVLLTARRLHRCRPGNGGFDPVP